MTDQPPPPDPDLDLPLRDLEDVREKLIEKVRSLDNRERLEFLEMIAFLPEYPFSNEMGLEILLSVAGYVSAARDCLEGAIERRRAEKDGSWEH